MSTAMRTHYPQHYAMVVLLAYTGLRWCHASALRWEDYDEEAGARADGGRAGRDQCAW